ncbi:hypothetical protein EC957_001577 [Mortierella hygrophila]|uniref:Phosphatidate phosphatase APP1 catalytic domain-containing protein n=1 Tax=Mortierella hygrophila TaxID=979708 RepID=A0A9P6FG01_9FUNG|nr:hypothetical protein EC957_001577 [Mortierella hygrophila]
MQTGFSASPSEAENVSGLVSNLNAASDSNGPTASNTPDSIASSSAASATSDHVQHCLLFPTYATRHSRSGSKNPDDWNIRVRGWAFSKRSNRRKRLVMSMARKIAGVTKDNNKVYETLESRFSMFLASNTQGAQFMVQCVGLASTTRMELAGGSDNIDDPSVDVLLDEIKSSESEPGLVHTEDANQEQADYFQLQSPDQDSSIRRGYGSIQPPLQHAAVTALKSQLSEQVQKSIQDERRKQLEDGAQLHTPVDHLDAGVQESIQIDTSDLPLVSEEGQSPTMAVGSVETESKFSARLSRGTAMFKNVVRKVTTSSVYSSNNSASTDSLRLPSGGTTAINNISDSSSVDEFTRPMVATRAASGASALTQDMTRQEDWGGGMFPTVPVASRPGGHFDGTLQMSSSEVEAHRRKDAAAGHPRLLKLHAYHTNMPDFCHGVVNLIDPEGVSIISDIDDTIKETNVTAGARIILRNTFLKDMMEVEGMASVYKGWCDQGAAIHYVSNSPWQLIPSLLEFFKTFKFPAGSAHLRLHDNVLKTYFMDPGENKRRSIREILTDFPDRKFILVGDSGEIDMEIYTEMAQEFPGQIVKIFIRDITTSRLKEIVSKMPPTRSLSFSSLLLPKTPLGFFGRRGSNTNASTSNVATTSSTDEDYDNDEDDNDEDIDSNNTLKSGIRGDLGEFKLERPRYHLHGGPMSPGLDPSRPLTPPAVSLSTTPTSSAASSPRLQPKQITATVKAVFTSPFRRASPNNKQTAVNDWNALKKRGGGMSPASPLSEGAGPMAGYPFPKVGSATSSSVSSMSGHQQRARRNGGGYDEEDYGLNSTLSYNSAASSNQAHLTGGADVFDDQDHQHVMLQQQQQQQQRTRQRTLSFTSITNSPPRSPKIPIRRTTEFFTRQEHHPLEMAMTATSPFDGPMGGNNNIGGTGVGGQRQGRVAEPQSSSPSLSPSSPSSPVATTPTSFTTNTKNPLEVWQDRIQQCRLRLPKGVLTLFESAEELKQCEVVQDVFRKFGGGSSSEADDEHVDGDLASEGQSEFLTEASMSMSVRTTSSTTATTTTTTAMSSSFKSNQESFSMSTMSFKSVSVSSQTNNNHTLPDVGRILKGVVAN